MDYFEVPTEPVLASPGILGSVFQQDNHRDKFDIENRLIHMLGISVDAVFIGDSMTEGWPVDKLLRAEFPHSVNRGVGGDCARHLPARLEADVLQLKPKNVILMIGTNDVSYRFGYDTDETIVSDYVWNMTGILGRLHASHSRCFVGTIPPPRRLKLNDREYDRKCATIPLMNDAIRTLTARFEMCLVDYYPHFFDGGGNLREDLYTDHVHVNTRGLYLMTHILHEAVQQARNSSPKAS